MIISAYGARDGAASESAGLYNLNNHDYSAVRHRDRPGDRAAAAAVSLARYYVTQSRCSLAVTA